jgi:glycosyltransferase involved in cell wall biosynthesis
MLLTVAICTWNRADELCITLESLAQMKGHAEIPWELIVVNNRCADHTDEVLAEYMDRLPITRVYESEPGLSCARNAAARIARGDYIIFTDDDISFSKEWLKSYWNAFSAHPDVTVFGGPIVPKFVKPPPEWLLRSWRHVSSVYGERLVQSRELVDISPPRVPFGANYAIRMREQRELHYDVNLGMKHGKTFAGEETSLMAKLLSSGHKGKWVPDAVVFHRIPPHHMTTAYVRRYYRGQGHFAARTGDSVTGPRWFGCPRWMWRAWIAAELMWRVSRLGSNPAVWLDRMTEAAHLRGSLDEFRRVEAENRIKKKRS